ncbi:MAG: nicotinate (nicotinamide) nucleotide adenylyltransferase [Verrucomicrobiales bacterium]|nr:nicotinate (nicotinamide) nucleotide adenylyltransferase [Verrucomicrobiales bacterium]
MPENSPQRLALFGGTFDPVHNGHLELVEAAFRVCNVDRVIFVPCAQSPFKSGQATRANAEERFEMIENALAAREWGESRATVSRFEIDRPPPSYSWETAAQFSDLESDADWHWIVGTDQWEEIERWANPDILRELLTFIVVTRDGDEIEERDGWRHIPVPFEHPASATAIREGRGKPEWIPEPNREMVARIYGA